MKIEKNHFSNFVQYSQKNAFLSQNPTQNVNDFNKNKIYN